MPGYATRLLHSVCSVRLVQVLPQQHHRPEVRNAIMVIGANPTDGHPVTGVSWKQFAMSEDLR